MRAQTEKQKQENKDEHTATPAVKPEIPPSLVRAGITGYSSNLQPGDRVKLPVDTFFLLFKKELMERCTTISESRTSSEKINKPS